MPFISDSERLLPMATAVSLFRAQVNRQRGAMSYKEMRNAIDMELAAHEDLTLVVEAQALIGAAILQMLEDLAEDGITAESVLLVLGREYPEG